MAAKPISKEKVDRIFSLRRQGLSQREIARQLRISMGSVSNYLKNVEEPEEDRGHGSPPPKKINQVIDRSKVDGTIELVRMERPASPDELMRLVDLDPKLWIPVHYKPNSWQGFAVIKGVVEKVQLYQSKATFRRIVDHSVEEALLEWVKENVGPIPAPPKAKRAKAPQPQLLVWGLWDAHLGMYAWNKEVGADFDLNIATTRVKHSIDDMIEELRGYPIGKILMPVGNDFMHFDSVRHKTTFGDHFLDTDTRYAKVYIAALECLSYMVERATEVCDEIELLYVPGNHDYTSGFTLTVALAQRYRDWKNVSVDLSMNPRKYRSHGGVLLGFDHGKDVRADHYPTLIASEAKELWSKSTWREVQIGHTHQRRETMYNGVTPTNGVLVRTNPSLSNVDAWHHSKGFIGEPLKSVEAWRYDDVGYRGSHVTWARDD